MSRSAKAKDNLLTYDGAIYRIEADALADFLARGIVVPDPDEGGTFTLAPDHVFAEVDAQALPVWRRSGFDPRGALMSMLSTHRDGQGGR